MERNLSNNGVFLRIISIIIISLSLAACGGGGDDDGGDGGGSGGTQIVDTDSDGIEDGVDNCPSIANPVQADIDSDNIGDACDDDNGGGGGGTQIVDLDSDGIEDGIDNCPAVANPDQADIDSDNIGDACDDDDDNDNIPNTSDIDDDNDGLIEIASLEQLDWMRNDLTGASLTDHDANSTMVGCPNTGCSGYELVADLDFDTNADGVLDANDTYFDYDGDGQNNGWLPVGTDVVPFVTTFEGNNHRIRNLHINRNSTDTETSGRYIGLFGYVDGTSATTLEIRNLGLDGDLMQLIGRSFIGGLVGEAIDNVTIINSYSTGNVTSSGALTGGLVGRASNNITITNSYATGNVTGQSSIHGGLVGLTFDTVTITNSYATGNVTGFATHTGGLVGKAEHGITIATSYATGNVTGSDTRTGGLVGEAEDDTTITNSYATGNVTGFNFYTGGLVGLAENDTTITHSYATGQVVGTDYTGGLVGSVNFYNSIVSTVPTIINNSFSTSSVSTRGNNDYVGGLVGISFFAVLQDSFATGTVSSANQFVGGLVGYAVGPNSFRSSFAANMVSGVTDVGALVGFSDSDYIDNYFANNLGITDALGTNSSTPGDVNPPGTTGDSLSKLQAATAAGGNGLFTTWGGSVWDFGNNTQLPGLVIDGVVFRDGDADGVLD